MMDPATAPTSAQDHNKTRAERSDVSRTSASRKGLTGPPSSTAVSKRKRRNVRGNAHARSDAPGPAYQHNRLPSLPRDREPNRREPSVRMVTLS